MAKYVGEVVVVATAVMGRHCQGKDILHEGGAIDAVRAHYKLLAVGGAVEGLGHVGCAYEKAAVFHYGLLERHVLEPTVAAE